MSRSYDCWITSTMQSVHITTKVCDLARCTRYIFICCISLVLDMWWLSLVLRLSPPKPYLQKTTEIMFITDGQPCKSCMEQMTIVHGNKANYMLKAVRLGTWEWYISLLSCMINVIVVMSLVKTCCKNGGQNRL